MATILVADDHPLFLQELQEYLEREGFSTLTASDAEGGIKIAQNVTIDVALVDLFLPSPEDGVRLLNELKHIDEHVCVIVMTAFGSDKRAVQVMREQAFSYFEKPSHYADAGRVVAEIEEALAHREWVLAREDEYGQARRHAHRFRSSAQQWEYVQRFSKQLDLVEQTRQGNDKHAQGQELENLACLIFEPIPGIEVCERNLRSASEEIDLLLINESSIPFWHDRIGSPFAVECKNWNRPVGAAVVRSFRELLRGKGIMTGFLLSMEGITGNQYKDAMEVVRQSVRDRIFVVIPLDKEHLKQIAESSHPSGILRDAYYDLWRL